VKIFHSDVSFSGSGKDQEERGEGCDFGNCPPKTRVDRKDIPLIAKDDSIEVYSFTAKGC
jgi:hypothetical protein